MAARRPAQQVNDADRGGRTSHLYRSNYRTSGALQRRQSGIRRLATVRTTDMEKRCAVETRIASLANDVTFDEPRELDNWDRTALNRNDRRRIDTARKRGATSRPAAATMGVPPSRRGQLGEPRRLILLESLR